MDSGLAAPRRAGMTIKKSEGDGSITAYLDEPPAGRE
jgi:hypothetical protein